jgi:hypothetical protein
MPTALSNVCYRGNSGHGAAIAECPLMTQTRQYEQLASLPL